MTLTKTAAVVRKGVVLSAVMVVVYYISIFAIVPLTKNAFKSIFPPKDPPTPIFGKLQQLVFTETKLTNATPPSIKLDTKDGKLPSGMPAKMTVYKFKPVPFSYQSGKAAIDDAAVLGFYNEDLVTDLKGTKFAWRQAVSGGVLEINKDTREISLISPLEGKGDSCQKGFLFANRAIDSAKEMFNGIDRFDDNPYINGYQKVTLGKFQNDKVVQTTIPTEAQIARVDFFRKAGGYDIVTPTFSRGLLYAYVRGNIRTTPDPYYNYPVVEAHIWSIDSQSNATYPIIPVADVWSKIVNNEGVIVNVTPSDGNIFESQPPVKVEEIYINKIYLAYYDNKSLQKYLQPIYVFEGKYTTQGTPGGSIAIYYPAISGEYVE